jgi:hypothetical protein
VIHENEMMLYKNQGNNVMVQVQSCELNQNGVLEYSIRFPEGHEKRVTRELLSRPENPDFVDLPRTTTEYRNTAGMLSEEEIRRIANPPQLSPLQQDFLNVHHRLFHLPFAIMFKLAKIGILPKNYLSLQDKPPPCVSCLFGTAHRKPWRSKKAKDREQATLRGAKITKPGQVVSVDQIVSAQPGLLPQEKGQLTRSRIWGCTVFVDHFTNYVSIALMRDLSAEATLEAKRDFEHKCAIRGVKVQQYHADNGRFAEKLFKDDCKAQGQHLTFCGVGAHHQNGIVERKIKDITLATRTILLHAMRYWPEYITTMLWPFAAKCIEDRINNLTVNDLGITPEMSFSGSQASQVQLKNYHPFGCPCYVLDSRVQTNPKGLPKWEPRARLAIYVGHSPAHAGSVALVLNPKTGLVSPQYHVVFDDNFTTIPNLRVGSQPSNWEELVRSSTEVATERDYDITRTWFKQESDPTADEELTSDDITNNVNPEDVRANVQTNHNTSMHSK